MLLTMLLTMSYEGQKPISRKNPCHFPNEGLKNLKIKSQNLQNISENPKNLKNLHKDPQNL